MLTADCVGMAAALLHHLLSSLLKCLGILESNPLIVQVCEKGSQSG